MSLLQLLRKPAERNLLDVLTKLPQLAVGSKVTRKSWEPYGDSYWEVTEVAPRNADGSYGKVWGVRTWRGERDGRPRHINGRAKKIWRWVPSQQEAEQLKPLVQELQQLKAWQGLAAKRAQSSSEAASEAAS